MIAVDSCIVVSCYIISRYEIICEEIVSVIVEVICQIKLFNVLDIVIICCVSLIVDCVIIYRVCINVINTVKNTYIKCLNYLFTCDRIFVLSFTWCSNCAAVQKNAINAKYLINSVRIFLFITCGYPFNILACLCFLSNYAVIVIRMISCNVTSL